MTARRSFLRDRRGASAAEFALVLPLAILILFGIIDAGRYAWELNRLEKAAEAGARYAVATRLVPTGLNSYDTVGLTCPAPVGTIEIGDRICKEALGTIVCQSAGSGATCTCKPGSGPCPDLGEVDSTAFADIVERMRFFAPSLRPEHITVNYSGSGIGYAGDPSTDEDGEPLSDIAPLVTVRIANLRIQSLFLFWNQGGTEKLRLPEITAALTLEDGVGQKAY